MSDEPQLPNFPLPRRSALDPPRGYAEMAGGDGLGRVALYDGRPAWLATGHAAVRRILADDSVSADRGNPDFPFSSPSRIAVEREARTFITMDGARHRDTRRHFTRYFAVRRIEEHRAMIEEVVDDLISELRTAGSPTDFMRNFAMELPGRAICRLLGIDQSEQHVLQQLDHQRNSLGTAQAEISAATTRQVEFLGQLLDQKLEEPDGAMISDMAEKLLMTGLVDRETLVNSIRLLMTAGHETTANMIALSVVTLLLHPDQLALLLDDESLVPGAVEELLRYLSIFHISPTRVATSPVTVGEKTIQLGEGIIPAVAGANRDPEVFADPDRFDIRRDARAHLAFGFGPHQCLGQPLARLELQVSLERVFHGLPGLHFAGSLEDLRLREYAFLSLETLPLSWEERR